MRAIVRVAGRRVKFATTGIGATTQVGVDWVWDLWNQQAATFVYAARVLFVVHSVSEGRDRIRIISARKASPTQRKAYEAG